MPTSDSGSRPLAAGRTARGRRWRAPVGWFLHSWPDAGVREAANVADFQRDGSCQNLGNPWQRHQPLHLRSEEHTSELQSQSNLVCRLLLEKKKNNRITPLIPLASFGIHALSCAGSNGGLPRMIT